MAEDSQNSKKKIFSKIQNLGNVGKAIDSMDAQKKMQASMGSFGSVDTKDNNMLDYFMDLIQMVGGKDAVTRVKKKVINKVTTEFRTEVKDMLFEEFLSFTNCDLGFVIPSSGQGAPGDGGNDIKFKVKSIDPFGLLLVEPNTKVGSAMYEKEDVVSGTMPYPTNKELRERLDNPNALLTSYNGGSGSALFDIEYDNVDSYIVKPIGLDGSYSSNPLIAGNDRKVTEFLRDYFDSVDVFQKHNFMAVIFNVLSGVIDVQIPKGTIDLELEGKFLDIIKRLMGMCGDDENSESGDGITTNPLDHLAEDDIPEDDFFDFGPQELRRIEDEVSLKLKALMRFASCTEIETKMNIDIVNSSIDNIKNETDSVVQDMLIEKAITDALNGLDTEDDFNIGIKLPGIGVDFNLDLLKKLPLILISLILSPKVLLPLVIVIIALGGTFKAEDILDLLKKLWKLIKRMLKRIIKFILEVLYEEIKRAILKLIEKILMMIIGEQNLKMFTIINSLLALLSTILETIQDFMNCKNILGTLLSLVHLPPIPGGINIPTPMLFATKLRSGFSDTRALQNVLENFQTAGINTEDHADGSPNQTVLMVNALIKGVEKERSQNSVVKVAIPPMTVTTPNGPGTTMAGSGTGLVV
jgi:hypothetical protein